MYVRPRKGKRSVPIRKMNTAEAM
ncbi:hypothetical protein ACFSC4_01050 [Deinococcus malanensis]